MGGGGVNRGGGGGGRTLSSCWQLIGSRSTAPSRLARLPSTGSVANAKLSLQQQSKQPRDRCIGCTTVTELRTVRFSRRVVGKTPKCVCHCDMASVVVSKLLITRAFSLNQPIPFSEFHEKSSPLGFTHYATCVIYHVWMCHATIWRWSPDDRLLWRHCTIFIILLNIGVYGTNMSLRPYRYKVC